MLFSVNALIGGMLIGLAVVLLWLGIGRIAGVSGILSQLRINKQVETGWRWAFVLGVIMTAYLASLLGYQLPTINPMQHNIVWFLAAGLLVGYGAKLGSGCTSGHGICGLGRFSKRSLIATCIFMGTAVMTVYVMR